MAEHPGPITSFAPLPLNPSVGLPGGSVTDRLRRLAQVEPESFRAGQADFSSQAFVDPRPEREQLQARLLQFNLAIPGEDIGTVMGKALSLEVHLLKTEQARAGAAAQRIRATQEDIRGQEIARQLAKARSRVTRPLVDPDQALVEEATDVLDDQQTLQKRLESMARLTQAELSAELSGAPVGLADPFRRKLEEELLAAAEEQTVNPDRIPLDQVKRLLLGFRLLDEQSRASGEVINSRKIVKAFQPVLDKADEGGLRLRLKIELQGMVAKRKSLPGPFLDALILSPLGTRKAHLFSRGFADGATVGLSEIPITGILGEKGLADQMAAGDTGDSVAIMLGFMAGATTNFVALDRALARAGVKSFSARSLPERMAMETVVFDVARVPSIVILGRRQNLSDDQINRQIFVELGLGLLAGATLGLGGAATSFGAREFSRMAAKAGQGLGRIAREAPEKFPRILDLIDGFDLMATTMVQGVSGAPLKTEIRSLPELRRMVQAIADQQGLSAGELGKVVRQVAPKRGKAGDLEELSVRETASVVRRLLIPEPTVPRGTKLNDEDHLFFAVPAREADELRRGGVTPLGIPFHATPRAAAANVKGKAEVFAIPASVVRSIPDSADARAAMEVIELPGLSKTVQGGREGETLTQQLKGFREPSESFGLSPMDLLAAEPVPGAIHALEAGLGRVGSLRRRILPTEVLQAHAYGEAFWGLSRNMIEAAAPVAGRKLVQMMDQFQDVSRLKGEPLRRIEDLFLSLKTSEINEVRLMLGGRKPAPAAEDTSRLARAYRQGTKIDDDVMDVMEATNPDGSVVLKADGSPFRRLDGHMEQPLARKLANAIETGSTLSMKLDPKTSKFRYWDKKNKKFAKLPVVGRLLKAQTKRLVLYNDFIDDIARQMDEKGMRYRASDQSFLDGQTTRAAREELKKQARRFLRDHRDAVLASQYMRPGTPSSRELMEGGRPRRVGAIDFARRFEYDLKFIRPNLGDNWIRHIHQLFDRRAESLVFGEKLERLGGVLREIELEVTARLGKEAANRTIESITKLYARDTGNLAIQGAINAFDNTSTKVSQIVRTLTGAAFLGPGSTFQFGGNAIWAVFGAASQLPIRTTMREFGFANLAVSAAGGVIGSEFGELLGDTPEERLLNSRRLMILGAGIGFGVTLGRDTTTRALVPAALPTAAALAGFFGPGAETDPVHRKLLAVGGFLAGTGAARSRVIRRLATSPTAVRAAKDAGALDVSGVIQAQPDLATNALAEAFRATPDSPVRQFAKDVMFGVTQSFEVWARASSAKAAASAAGDMVGRLAKDSALRGTPTGKFFVRQLQRLGISEKTLNKIIEKNDAIIPDALLDRILARGVENTQYVLRAMDLPLMWSSPWGRVFTQFMGMGLRQFQNTTRFALQEAGLGNWGQLGKILPMAVVSGLGVDEIRKLVNGRDLEPRTINKLTRFVQILGPAMGLFGDAARGIARFTEGVRAGEATQDVFEPAALDASKNIVNALVESFKALVTGDPDMRTGRSGLDRAFRAFPSVRILDTAVERDFPTDDDIIRQFSAQMPRALQQIAAAEQGKSLIDFLQGLPEPAFPEARRLAERATPAIEGALRGVASGLGFLPGIAPSLEAEEAKAESIRQRLAQAPGVLERRAALESRIKRKPITPGGVRERLIKQAESASRKGIIERIATGIRNKDRPGVIDKIEQFVRMGGKASTVINALRQRALTAGDESLATSVPESLIHRLELQENKPSLAEVSRELAKRPRNPARMRALIEYRRSFTAAP